MPGNKPPFYYWDACLTTSEQVSRFIETARALGCDEDKERFEAALGKIAAHKRENASPKKPKNKPKS